MRGHWQPTFKVLVHAFNLHLHQYQKELMKRWSQITGEGGVWSTLDNIGHLSLYYQWNLYLNLKSWRVFGCPSVTKFIHGWYNFDELMDLSTTIVRLPPCAYYDQQSLLIFNSSSAECDKKNYWKKYPATKMIGKILLLERSSLRWQFYVENSLELGFCGLCCFDHWCIDDWSISMKNRLKTWISRLNGGGHGILQLAWR